MILKPKYGPLTYILPIWFIFIALVCVLYAISRDMVEHRETHCGFFIGWYGIDILILGIPITIMFLVSMGISSDIYRSYPIIHRFFINDGAWDDYLYMVAKLMFTTGFIPPIVQLVLVFI